MSYRVKFCLSGKLRVTISNIKLPNIKLEIRHWNVNNVM